MGNQFRVCWLHHSKVYHRADFHYSVSLITPLIFAPCGVVVFSQRFRCQEGTALEARRLGLRPCLHCFKAP